MKKIDLGQTIGIVANLGAISGIVFLALEIRQSNIQARAAAYQAIGMATASVFSTWRADAEGLASSLIPAEQRTPEDWLRDSLLDSAFARLGETILLQVDQGLLPEDSIQRLGYQAWTTRLQTPEGVCTWHVSL